MIGQLGQLLLLFFLNATRPRRSRHLRALTLSVLGISPRFLSDAPTGFKWGKAASFFRGSEASPSKQARVQSSPTPEMFPILFFLNRGTRKTS